MPCHQFLEALAAFRKLRWTYWQKRFPLKPRVKFFTLNSVLLLHFYLHFGNVLSFGQSCTALCQPVRIFPAADYHMKNVVNTR